MAALAHPSPCTKRHLSRFNHLCMACGCVQHTCHATVIRTGHILCNVGGLLMVLLWFGWDAGRCLMTWRRCGRQLVETTGVCRRRCSATPASCSSICVPVSRHHKTASLLSPMTTRNTVVLWTFTQTLMPDFSVSYFCFCSSYFTLSALFRPHHYP